jgi:ADP-ribose pyrophosphatase YjhB (NUDIX family)
MPHDFHPSVTVAAVVYQGGRYLIVEEDTPEGVRYNQPAGHLEPGESLVAAVVRETLEESARDFVPRGLLGVYLCRSRSSFSDRDVTYLRFAFVGDVGETIAGRRLDTGILRAVWLTAEELADLRGQHRSPLVMRCVLDHQQGRAPGPIELLVADPSALDSLNASLNAPPSDPLTARSERP